ncbi:MAG: hypothetical protein M0T80_14980 [Actinomycetota bacterium]|nr:hypothetical protein [Actinomycetota bacterium]
MTELTPVTLVTVPWGIVQDLEKTDLEKTEASRSSGALRLLQRSARNKEPVGPS